MRHPSVLPTDVDRARRVVCAVADPDLPVDSLDLVLLEDIAAGLSRSVSPDLLPTGPGRRWARLLATRSYDAWLIGWPPGTGLPLHDHGRSIGALRVVHGTLGERRLHRTSPTPMVSRRITAGDGASFGAGHVHAVHNLSRTPALSVHVYSPPLTAMNFVESHDARAVS
jgi:hypothetical protein